MFALADGSFPRASALTFQNTDKAWVNRLTYQTRDIKLLVLMMLFIPNFEEMPFTKSAKVLILHYRAEREKKEYTRSRIGPLSCLPVVETRHRIEDVLGNPLLYYLALSTEHGPWLELGCFPSTEKNRIRLEGFNFGGKETCSDYRAPRFQQHFLPRRKRGFWAANERKDSEALTLEASIINNQIPDLAESDLDVM
ncbi:unnamed protein product [Cyprideis torosa]|uniref:Uncharacterized protein n=1 Tax=Cyprideis torosa TaxID=163714 RepID=A0A7R8ZGG3_9CRUS|nr:unnamed protein product [Cyprideis torosa]CAG0881589.1 unnamed protein product [Cyprideis torosa]